MPNIVTIVWSITQLKTNPTNHQSSNQNYNRHTPLRINNLLSAEIEYSESNMDITDNINHMNVMNWSSFWNLSHLLSSPVNKLFNVKIYAYFYSSQEASFRYSASRHIADTQLPGHNGWKSYYDEK